MRSHTAPKGTFPVFSTHVERVDDLPGQLDPPTQRFVLLIAADTSRMAGPDLVKLAGIVLNRGAIYVCCWGPDADRLESCFDEAACAQDEFAVSDRVIMTTAHADEPLEDAMWFAVHAAYPDHGWESGTGAIVIATVGDATWAAAAVEYLEAGAPIRDAA